MASINPRRSVIHEGRPPSSQFRTLIELSRLVRSESIQIRHDLDVDRCWIIWAVSFFFDSDTWNILVKGFGDGLGKMVMNAFLRFSVRILEKFRNYVFDLIF